MIRVLEGCVGGRKKKQQLTSLCLNLVVFDIWRSQTIGTQVLAKLRRVGHIIVAATVVLCQKLHGCDHRRKE